MLWNRFTMLRHSVMMMWNRFFFSPDKKFGGFRNNHYLCTQNQCEMTNTVKTLKPVIICCLLAMLSITAWADNGSCPVIRMEAERLPDMNIPRYGFNVFCQNGEPIVIGGHTSGFVLTPTAEYFKDGEWHLLQTVYLHDAGFAIAMKSGKVLIAGGFKENLGIGQSFEVEMYDPESHQFEGFGCLDKKRASAGAVELDSGRVLITGNWYAGDAMEIYDGEVSFSYAKEVSQTRNLPHVFRISDNDALVLAGYDYHGQRIDTILIDRLHGAPFRDPLFDVWHPLHYDLSVQSGDSFIGDEAEGIYAYLMPVEDDNGQLAIAEVRDTVFSLLPTTGPVPMQSQWGRIIYYTPVYTDRQRQCGYIVGADSTGRQYALCIDYAKKPAPLTLYHTDELTDTTALTIPVLTDEGNLLLTGFRSYKTNSNFSPSASVWLLRLHDGSESASMGKLNGWLWVVIALGILAVISVVVIWQGKKKPSAPSEPADSQELPTVQNGEPLMERIRQLMEEQKPYLNSELKVADIADALHVRRSLISDCVSSLEGCTFSMFINRYRVDYAKQLLHQHPDKKINTVGQESGFANETSFFRTFKAITGMTPNEWKGRID